MRPRPSAVRAGNYPWPSAYIAGSAAEPMPAWPMQHACAPLAVDLADTTLLQAMREAVGVLYNHTKDAPCYELPGTLRQRMPSFGARRGIALSRKGFMRCGLPCLPWDQRCRHRAHRPTDGLTRAYVSADYPSAQTPSAPIDGQWDWQW